MCPYLLRVGLNMVPTHVTNQYFLLIPFNIHFNVLLQAVSTLCIHTAYPRRSHTAVCLYHVHHSTDTGILACNMNYQLNFPKEYQLIDAQGKPHSFVKFVFRNNS